MRWSGVPSRRSSVVQPRKMLSAGGFSSRSRNVKSAPFVALSVARTVEPSELSNVAGSGGNAPQEGVTYDQNASTEAAEAGEEKQWLAVRR